MIALFKIDFEDIMAMQQDVLISSKFQKRRKLIIGLTGFVGFFIWLILRGKGILPSLFYASILLLITQYIFIPLSLIKIRWVLKKNNNKYTFLTGDCKLTIDSEGLLKKSDNATEYTKWSQIKKVRTDEKRYFFYQTERNVFMIKKSPDNMNGTEMLEYNQLINEFLDKEGLNKKM